MTEQEAIEELKYDCNELGKAIPCDTSWGVAIDEAYNMAIKALEEVQQYRKFGTVRQVEDFIADWRKYRELGNLEELWELISKGRAYEQLEWERNIAISQLEEIGCSLGQKMDKVKEAMGKAKGVNELNLI